eukprot:919077_1
MEDSDDEGRIVWKANSSHDELPTAKSPTAPTRQPTANPPPVQSGWEKMARERRAKQRAKFFSVYMSKMARIRSERMEELRRADINKNEGKSTKSEGNRTDNSDGNRRSDDCGEKSCSKKLTGNIDECGVSQKGGTDDDDCEVQPKYGDLVEGSRCSINNDCSDENTTCSSDDDRSTPTRLSSALSKQKRANSSDSPVPKRIQSRRTVADRSMGATIGSTSKPSTNIEIATNPKLFESTRSSAITPERQTNSSTVIKPCSGQIRISQTVEISHASLSESDDRLTGEIDCLKDGMNGPITPLPDSTCGHVSSTEVNLGMTTGVSSTVDTNVQNGMTSEATTGATIEVTTSQNATGASGGVFVPGTPDESPTTGVTTAAITEATAEITTGATTEMITEATTEVITSQRATSAPSGVFVPGTPPDESPPSCRFISRKRPATHLIRSEPVKRQKSMSTDPEQVSTKHPRRRRRSVSGFFDDLISRKNRNLQQESLPVTFGRSGRNGEIKPMMM